MCLEVSYRNIRITDAWKRNRSDVCAWRYHTEILELQRDGREIEVLYALGSIFQAHTILLFLFHLSVILIFLYDTSKHIQHFYFSSELQRAGREIEVMYVLGSIIQKY
jgi:hypothetical protein